MENVFYIAALEDSPEILFDYQKGKLCISGTSWLEDAYSFYEPLLNNLKVYFAEPKSLIDIEFKFIYLNTSSAKQIARLISLIGELKGECKVKVKWSYEKDDLEMLKMGKKYSAMLKVAFDFVETDSEEEVEDYQEGVYNIVKH